MDNNFAFKWAELLRQLIVLPAIWRESLAWILRHSEFLIELCRLEAFKEEKRAELEAKATEEEDIISYLIVQLERAVHTK